MREVFWDIRARSGLDSEKISMIEDILIKVGHKIESDAHHVFDNGAITLVYMLSESHFFLHTQPDWEMVYCNFLSRKNYARSTFEEIVRRITDILEGQIERINMTESNSPDTC